MEGSGRGGISTSFRSKTLENFGTAVASSFLSLLTYNYQQSAYILRRVPTSPHWLPLPGPSHPLFSKPPHPFYAVPFLSPCSRSSVLHRAARGILLKHSCQISLFCLKASSDLKIKFIYNSALPPSPPVPACQPHLSSNTPQPPGLCTLVPLPWNTLGPGAGNPCLFPSFIRGSAQMENMLHRSPGWPPSLSQPPTPARLSLTPALPCPAGPSLGAGASSWVPATRKLPPHSRHSKNEKGSDTKVLAPLTAPDQAKMTHHPV